MQTSDFNFTLPEHLIALNPAARRDSARLMVLKAGAGPVDKTFSDLPDLLEAGDMLVLNRTKVLPVRLRGVKPGGGALDIVLVRHLGSRRWEVLSRGSYSGELRISEKLGATIEEGRIAELRYTGDLAGLLWEVGQMPLPPYIKRPPKKEDKLRYQTVYARDEGSIAAPTAGLHFTEALLEALGAKGVALRYLTLHVGVGTFTPIRVEDLAEHSMAGEEFEIKKDLIDEIAGWGGRVIAVGTTTTRALEGAVSGNFTPTGDDNRSGDGVLRGRTNIFIRPGHDFKAIGGIITNFHLPRSTPLMLAAAMAGRERLLDAYAHAIGGNYRFFSYGDAMLIL